MRTNPRTWRRATVPLVVPVACLPVGAGTETFAPDSLIIPMDTTYQNYGMLEAYGLVYQLLRSGVPVDWVIAPAKAYGAVDFQASAIDVQSSLPIVNHGYRGGPFVIAAPHLSAALPVVQAWQLGHSQVSVHRATAPFTANVSRELRHAPTIAVFSDGNEDIAFKYLNAAAIPMSNGAAWPTKKDGSAVYPSPGPSVVPTA